MTVMTVTSREYAEALFELALEDNNKENIFESLKSVIKEINAQDSYLEFLASPAIPVEERVKAINEAFDGYAEEKVVSFLCLLCEKGRIREIGECLEAFEELYLASENISTAEVTSAKALSDEEKQRLTEKLEKRFGKKFVIEYFVDSSILGGAVIKTDGVVFDGSLKKRLEGAKEVMQG